MNLADLVPEEEEAAAALGMEEAEIEEDVASALNVGVDDDQD